MAKSPLCLKRTAWKHSSKITNASWRNVSGSDKFLLVKFNSNKFICCSAYLWIKFRINVNFQTLSIRLSKTIEGTFFIQWLWDICCKGVVTPLGGTTVIRTGRIYQSVEDTKDFFNNQFSSEILLIATRISMLESGISCEILVLFWNVCDS